MRLTETLDALLRLLLTSEDGDAPAATAARTAQTAATTRPAEANPPAQDTVSRDGGLPIEEDVHLRRPSNDGPASPATEVEHRAEVERPVAAPAESLEPSEHALPEWVRRVREHRIEDDARAPAADELEVELVEQFTPPAPAVVSPLLASTPDPVETGPDNADVSATIDPELRTEWYFQPQPEPEPYPEPIAEPVAEPGPEPAPFISLFAPAEPLATDQDDQGAPDESDEAGPEAPDAGGSSATASWGTTFPGTVTEDGHDEEIVEDHAHEESVEPSMALVPTAQELTRLEATAQVVESLNLGFHLGAAVERIAAAAELGSDGVPALREATWLIERYVALIERRPIGADLHVSAARLARTGDAIADLKALATALEDAAEQQRVRDTEHLGVVTTEAPADPRSGADDAWVAPGDDDSDDPPFSGLRPLT